MIKIDKNDLKIIESLYILRNNNIIEDSLYNEKYWDLESKYIKEIQLDLIDRISKMNINRKYYYNIIIDDEMIREFYLELDDCFIENFLENYNKLSNDNIINILNDIQ